MEWTTYLCSSRLMSPNFAKMPSCRIHTCPEIRKTLGQSRSIVLFLLDRGPGQASQTADPWCLEARLGLIRRQRQQQHVLPWQKRRSLPSFAMCVRSGLVVGHALPMSKVSSKACPIVLLTYKYRPRAFAAVITHNAQPASVSYSKVPPPAAFHLLFCG